MTEPYLTCNLRHCTNKLKDQAYVTPCSHLFCLEHGQRAMKDNLVNKCLICERKFEDQHDFVLVNLNPTDKYKSMILTGLHPKAVLDIAMHSISSYISQLNYDNQIKDGVIRHMRPQNKEMKNYCQSITAKYKNDVLKYRSAVKSLEVQLRKRDKELARRKHQMGKYLKYITKLESQLYPKEAFKINQDREYMDSTLCLDSEPFHAQTPMVFKSQEHMPRIFNTSENSFRITKNPFKFSF